MHMNAYEHEHAVSYDLTGRQYNKNKILKYMLDDKIRDWEWQSLGNKEDICYTDGKFSWTGYDINFIKSNEAEPTQAFIDHVLKKTK